MSNSVAVLLMVLVAIGVWDLVTLLLQIRRDASAWYLSWTVGTALWALVLLIKEWNP